MHAPLSSELTSHVRLRSSDEAAGLASFDVTVYGPNGAVAVDIVDFSMIRVSGDALADAGPGADPPAWLRDAISPEEGREVFRRVLAALDVPHWLVATRPLDVLIEEAGRTPVRMKSSASRPPARVPMVDVAEALEAHEKVAEAAAVGSREAGKPARVVAFVVYEGGAHATVSELRRFTRDRVGTDLTPQNFVEMVSLPRDAGGSVAFAELRDPFAAVDDYVAPRTATEEAIAAIWAELLGLERVGVYDNFLDVGGHSLVGIRVLLRIQQATGVRLEANALTLQTLEQLAADVDRAGGTTAGAAADSTSEAAEDSPSAETMRAPETAGRRASSFLSRVKRAVTDL